MIQKKVSDGSLVSIRAGHHSQFPSYLLYTDDIIVFAQATLVNCKTIIQILRDYEVVSGQQVNRDKSYIL